MARKATPKLGIDGRQVKQQDSLNEVKQKAADVEASAIRSQNYQIHAHAMGVVQAMKLAGVEDRPSRVIVGMLLRAKQQETPELFQSWSTAGEEAYQAATRPDGRMRVGVENVEEGSALAKALNKHGLKIDTDYRSYRGSIDLRELVQILKGSAANAIVFPNSHKTPPEKAYRQLTLVENGNPVQETMRALGIEAPAAARPAPNFTRARTQSGAKEQDGGLQQ